MTDPTIVPLAKKLGIRSGYRMYVKNPPEHYLELIAPLPDGVTILKSVSDNLDIIHLFTKRFTELTSYLNSYLPRIKQNGTIWVSWPKRTSGVPADLDEDRIRKAALPLGLVDTKVCAVNAVWSALKLVKRRGDGR